ncbi:site-specific DNA-methyltransferase [Candidatus Amarolinea dominans]|uniref:site-specific DNA-methyltransferase n=1 Tax=Candidatus Amarolinea dominans TaxID=3140696 RepID=UPI001DFC1F0B|nr:site-specific DNA-methyltransferase [Anaerolineae bacterium]
MTITKLRPTFTFDEERLDALAAIAPEAFADGKINWDALREALGDHVEEDGRDAEHFGLFWPGKRAARRLASTPSAGTLKPAPGEGVNEATTRHLFIEGDNLEVLKLLQKSYAGRVKMIYIDPPYNTGNDFIYSDNFTQPLDEYLRATGQTDEAGRVLVTNTQAGGRYHSNWLSMMYPRLKLARTLLQDDGVIFVSIDDNELYHLRMLMNEVFGEESFFAAVIVQSNKRGQTYKQISKTHEYVLVYTNNPETEINELEKAGDSDDLNLADEIGRFNVREFAESESQIRKVQPAQPILSHLR